MNDKKQYVVDSVERVEHLKKYTKASIVDSFKNTYLVLMTEEVANQIQKEHPEWIVEINARYCHSCNCR